MAIQESPSQTAGSLLDGAADPGAAGGLPEVYVAPASFAQQRLWLIDRVMPGLPTYNVPLGFRVRGDLDLTVLERVLDALVERHEVLRTAFDEEEGEPVQLISSWLRVSLPRIDLSGLPAELREEEGLRQLRAEAARPFDLSRVPLWRPYAFRLADRDGFLLFQLHHIVTDDWSNGLFLRELLALYAAFRQGLPSPLPDAPLQYADFAEWQKEWLQGAALERRLDVLRRRLRGIPDSLALPTDRSRPAQEDPSGAEHTFALPTELVPELRALAHDAGGTLFTVLLASFEALLFRITGQGDFAVGSPVANRTRVETENVLGFFVNTVALRAETGDDPTFRDHLARVRTVSLEAFAHEDLPFEKLVEDLRPERRIDRHPLFQVMFSYHRPTPPAPEGGRAVLDLEPVPLRTDTAKVDLSLHAAETPGALHALWEYSSALFDRPTIARLTGHWQALLADAVAAPHRRLSALALLSEAERHQLRAEWNAPRPNASPAEPLHRLFARQAERTPDAVAVSGDRTAHTYRELRERAGRLARHLQGLGVGPGHLVGLCADRSPDLIAGMIGILEAGGAYLPLDPDYPADRLGFMVRDSRAFVLVSQRRRAARLLDVDPPVLILEDVLERDAAVATVASLPDVSPSSPAYVIYTSGSTGHPKGVPVPHANVVRLFAATRPWFHFGPADVWTWFHSFAFDFSVWEIWGALLHGGRLVAVPFDVSRSPESFLELLRREGVTVLNQTPSAFGPLTRLAAEAAAGIPPSLRWILFGGEALSLMALEPWFRRFGDRRPRLVNLYGITETTVHVTYRPIAAGETSPFGSPAGRPIPDQTVHLLDRFGNAVPLGVAGEIFVGGHGNAQGYLGRPDLTAERFLPDPYAEEPGARLYRSGDLARRLPDGQIEFLGRVDQQVKVRGFRIEPGEIEAVLASHPDLREAAVAVRQAPSGDALLAAYVVPRAGAGPGARALRDFLAARLPSYMVPAVFMKLEDLPRTASGKLDRRRLPAPRAESAGGYVAPRTPVEEILAGLFAGFLRADRIGAQDSFFDLGGHSLTATRLASQVRAAFGVELAVRAVFETPVLADLAARIERLLAAGGGSGLPPLVPVPRDGSPLPLSFAQRRLWFLDQLAEGRSPFYNVPVALRISGPLDAAALAAALAEVVRRHEALRTTFPQGPGGEPVQAIHSPGGFRLARLDLSGLPDPEAEARRLVRAESRRPFALATGPLLRALLCRLGGERAVLLIVQHHTVTDGWSVGILLREMAALYGAFRQGQPSPLPEPAIQYADYALWQRRWLAGEAFEAQLAFWRKQLEGAPPRLVIPLDRPRTSSLGHAGALVSTHLPEDAAGALERRARERRATPFMTLLAAFAVLLGRHAGQEDVVIGTPVANRGQAEVEGVAGFFVNLLPLRVDLSGDPSFRELLDRVRDSALGAYAHQDFPFEALVEALQPQRRAGETPIFQAAFSHEEAGGGLDLAGLDVRPLTVDHGVALFDLTLWVARPAPGLAEGLRIDLNFRTGLFDRTTAARLLESFRTFLEAAVALPEVPVGCLPLWSEATWHQTAREWNDTTVPIACETVLRLVEEQAALQPEVSAVEAPGERLTYGELNRRADVLAAELRRAGVGPEEIVALALPRGAGLTVAALAVWKAGGAYLPLDPFAPAERLAGLLREARPRVVIAEEGLRDRLAAHVGAQFIAPAAVRTENRTVLTGRGDEGAMNCAPTWHAHRAYLIFTSGSTGQPKGVEIEHGGLAQLISWSRREWSLAPGDRITQVANPAFDASVWETWACLAAGATLCVPPQEILASPRDLLRWMSGERITRSFLPPLVAAGVLQETSPPGLLLHTLWTGGDRCPALHPGRPYELVNLYGPTEATVMATFHRAIQDETPPIGRPLDGVEVFLLDPALRPAPSGAAGEIALGGRGLARGYLGRPEATAARFIPHPGSAEPGARLYRTGDLGRFRPDGTLEFLGRVDHQLKIRGFRVEPAEVEARLAAHPTVQEAVVTAEADASGNLRLVAWLTLRPGVAELADLRPFLQERLPEYMVPAAFHRLDAFPLTAAGKVDRAALPAALRQSEEQAAESRATSSDPVESTLAGLWRDVLELPRIGPDDNFFELGGHSFLLAVLRARIQEAFEVELPMMALFDNPTVGSQARHLRALKGLPVAVPETRPVPRPAPARDEPQGREIAVVGMAGRFPGANDLDQLWRNLRDGVEAISFYPPVASGDHQEGHGWQPPSGDRPFRVPASGVLDGVVEGWDYEFFGYGRREAELMDPQARLFLECAWEALENAGYEAGRYPGQVGVFGGASHGEYRIALVESGALHPGEGEMASLGNLHDLLTARVSHKLGLDGPSFSVQAACSTSLVAIHLACQSLLAGECDLALAGAAAVSPWQRAGYVHEPGGSMAPDGHCRSFDAAARGSVHSDGVGVVVLKRLADTLADGDTVRAVIRGSAVNNDGPGGFLVPKADGRARVVRDALRRAGVEPGTVSFLEGHGNGTPLGDLIELAALAEAYRGAGPAGSCVLGSVKSNLGHTQGASGVIGLIKTVLALEHREIPPTLHFQRADPEARLEKTPFRVATRLEPWAPPAGQPRRAGVSSFGHGGINAHVVLEEAPATPAPAASPDLPWQLLVLSARSEAALEEATDRLASYLRRHPTLSLADVAFTLQTGRRAFEHRRAAVARDLDEAAAALESRSPAHLRTGRAIRSSSFGNASGHGNGTSLGNAVPPAALLEDPQQFLLDLAFSGPEGEATRSLVVPYQPNADAETLSEAAHALLMLGELWSGGMEIDWAALHGAEGRRRVPLPGYPFQREPCWVLPRLEPPAAATAEDGGGGESDRRLDPGYQLRLYTEADDRSADV